MGPDGADGQDGEDGNANVFFSETFLPDWNRFDTATFKSMTVTDSRFNQVVSGDGIVVLFYWSTNNGSTFPLPWNSYSPSGSVLISRDYFLRGNNEVYINIRKFGSDFEEKETQGIVGSATYNRLRYVIIPSADLAAKSSLDFSDYEAVKAYYGVSE